MNIKAKKYLFSGIFSALMFFAAFVTFAIPASVPAGNPITIDDVSGIIGVIANFLIITSMVLAVIFIVLSGIMTMMAQANPTAFSKGLLRLRHATIGVAVVLGAGVIINTVAALVDRSFFCQLSVLGICLLK